MEFWLQGWPVSQPDIIVSTPAALLNYLFAFDSKMKRRSDFLRSVKSVVIDCFNPSHPLGDEFLTDNI